MNILLIEDDPFFQKVYSSKLTQEGFNVVVASNGEEGLAKIAQNPPDLILLDLIMPIKDGFDVLEALAQDPKNRNIPVIILSTLEQAQDVEKAKSLGAKDYINKSDLHIPILVNKIITLAGGKN